MSENHYELPKETAGDKVHLVARALISSIPFGGGAGLEFFNRLIATPVSKRLDRWMSSVAEGIQRLEDAHAVILDDLKRNEAFIDTALQAAEAARRTSSDEKREALRNAVLNSALPNPPDEAVRQQFLSLVDRFSALHLRLLAFFDDPEKWLEENGRPKFASERIESFWEVVVYAMPDTKRDEQICELTVKNLHDSGLLLVESLHDKPHNYNFDPKRPREQQIGYLDPWKSSSHEIYKASPTMWRNWTTYLGVRFLGFVSAPDTPKHTS